MSRLIPLHWSVVTWGCLSIWLLFTFAENLGGVGARNHGYAVDEAYSVVSGFPILHTEYRFGAYALTAKRDTSMSLLLTSGILNLIAVVGVVMLSERWTRNFTLAQLFMVVTILGGALSIYGRWAFSANLASRVETFILIVYFGPAFLFLADIGARRLVRWLRQRTHIAYVQRKRKRQNQEIHRSSGGPSTLHKYSTAGTR